ncbi:MAG TPA: ribbon-helix-helix protein, CopG family [Thermoanaerobaculia bacterium]|jgi:hypothetical protein|nr:ribbon-helix-helix protein, CopG family [Thermoanaerobaculia bacterium]
MATRVQVILEDEEKELFQHRARAEGLSLSAWLRRAGREFLRKQKKTATRADLDDFFKACDAREQGTEPDWEEHLRVIERSKRSGAAEA